MKNIKTISLITAMLLNICMQAEELSNIEISSSLIKSNELNSTKAIEIYTKEDIKKSNSKSIYDFLNTQTSANVFSSFGNTFTPKLDLRAYGISNGYQNIVISVNGRKLNNIDMVPSLLSSIPISSVEKLEIIKGSGSVAFGDGANAGVINIITNGKNDNFIKTSFGSNGLKNGVFSLSHSNDKIIINTLLDYTSTNGSRENSSGKKDKNYNRNKEISLYYFPSDSLELRLFRTFSTMNILYAGSLSLDEYKNNPNHANSLTEQYFNSYVTQVGATYTLNKNNSLDFNYSKEKKLSEYSTGYKSNYKYKSFNVKNLYNKNKYSIVIGLDGFNGDRISSSNITTKNNLAIFSSLTYKLNKNTTLNSGIRQERVTYKYNPNAGNSLSDDINLKAYDLGLNYKIDEKNSVFFNYNKSYQAADINRFFKNNVFNKFIKPSKVNNYTLGYNNIQKNNKLKISIFRSELKDEIYYYNTGNFATSYNTNIDKSHKYGLEIFDKHTFNYNFSGSINYSYLIAKIDEENEASGAYNGKNLPGVSKHNILANISYTYAKIKTILSHTYKSSAYAANDFKNEFSQKQEVYNSSDLNISYEYKKFEFFAKIQNLFNEDNALWIKDNSIYPNNFERRYNLGMQVNF